MNIHVARCEFSDLCGVNIVNYQLDNYRFSNISENTSVTRPSLPMCITLRQPSARYRKSVFQTVTGLGQFSPLNHAALNPLQHASESLVFTRFSTP